MRIAVVHNALAADSPTDEQDVAVQADAVCAALQASCHDPVRLTCGLNLAEARDRLDSMRPDLVFNLVESLAGSGRLIHLFPSLLDAMGLPYTGASAEAQFLTSNKLIAKQRLHAAGLPTAPWAALSRDGSFIPQTDDRRRSVRRWIVKSVWEHASIGLDAGAILGDPSPEEIRLRLSKDAARLGGACFAEAFIEGREFNLSVLDGPTGPEVLPPAEIIFEGFADGQARIVDYSAKWDEQSFAYHHTPRCFDFTPRDRELLEHLRRLALDCWRCFELGGYARVDFRVDQAGQPFILEINTNPCLSPDAGFAAAVDRAGLRFEQAIDRIVAAGCSICGSAR